MKRPSSVVFLLLLLAMASAAWAEAQDDKAAVTRTLNDYFALFADLGPSFDIQRVLSYYHEPMMLISAPRASVFMTRAESEAWLKSFIARLKERGYARSEAPQLHVKQVSAGVAVASVLAVRYKADGQELERVGLIYVLRKMSDGWKIAAVVGHDPGSVLRLD